MDNNSSSNLIHANFFFVDGVSLSDPTMSTRTQLKKIETLHEFVKKSSSFLQTPKDGRFVISTGDGMCIAFLQGIDLPLKLAMELQQQLEEYNKGKIPSEIIKIRIGLHRGDCFEFKNVDEQKSIWGPGIILAKRIMDLGEDGHILLSSTYAETLLELFDEYRKIVKPVRDYSLKHNIIMLIYSAYGKNFGNHNAPQKDELQKSKMNEEIIRLQNTTLYPKINVNLMVLDSQKMLIKHKRTYFISNISEEPIKYVLHGIGIDIPKSSINDLNLRIYEDLNTEMKISSINLDKPYTKEFSTVFEKPIMNNEIGRNYTVEYEIEEPERFYENAFLIDCKKFALSFSFQENGIIFKPTLYEVNQETERKTQSDFDEKIEKKNSVITMTWEINDIVKGQTFRIEW